MKKLAEMTLEELWQLFPIELTPYREEWKISFQQEKERLEDALNSFGVTINHIGSTAIGGIWAKPIVDVLVETAKENFCEVANIVERSGYLCMNRQNERISFNKGYTENGFAEKVFHLHLRVYGDNDELYFRDWLMLNEDVAKNYEKLKLSLWKEYRFNRDGYTNAKTEFVREQTAVAKEYFKMKYSK